MLSSGRTWLLLLAGDIMFNSIAPGNHSFDGIQAIVHKADVAFANLEVPLTTAKETTPHKSAAELKQRTQFILKANPKHAAEIASAGFRCVTLANNHCMDYRSAGLAEMESALDQAKVAHAGAGSDASKAMQMAIVAAPNGTRVGLISALAFVSDGALAHCTPAGPTSAGVNVFRFGGLITPAVRKKMNLWAKRAKAKCDVLVVGIHWGIERQTVPTDYQVSLAHAWIDAGADVVWGHHPHVLQGTEIYKGRPILYSMGNLVSSLGAKTGLALLTFDNKKFLGLRGVPCVISGGKVRTSKGNDPFPPLNDLFRHRYAKSKQPRRSKSDKLPAAGERDGGHPAGR